MGFDLLRALEGKAINPHPALQGSEPVSIYSPGANRQEARLTQREASRHSDAYGGKQAIDWVSDCIGLYRDALSVAPWHLERPDGTKLVRERTKGTPPDADVGPSELYDLLDKPNPFMLYDELVDLLIIDLLLVGNAYWLKWRMTSEGRPLALYRLAPSHVKIIPGPFGPKRYEYQPPGAKQPLKIDPTEITHFRLPNPHSAYYGLGVIQQGGRSFDLELAVTDTMASYYENKADPSMIIQSERRVPRDVFQKLRAQLRNRAAGSRNAGELLVLESGLKASSLSTSASDALFDKLLKMSRDRVFTKFRASPLLFGLMDEAAGGNKVSDARREFDNATLRPFADRLQRRITEAITAAWGIKFIIDYRYTMPLEELIKLGGDFAAVPGIKVREVRKFYAPLGIEESTGDQEIDEMVLNLPGEEMDEDGQGGFADRNAPTEAGRPPLGENTRAFPRNGQPLPEDAKVRRGAKSVEEVLNRLAQLEGKASPRLPGEQRPEDTVADDRERAVEAAALAIRNELEDATHLLERTLLDHVEGKAFQANDVLNRIKKSVAWQTFRERVETALQDGMRHAISQAVIHSTAQGVEPGEELDYDEIADRVLRRKGGLTGIVNTLRDGVAKAVKSSRDEGQGAVERAVRDTIRDWRLGKAEVIGVTEAVHAYNEATLTAAEASGVANVLVTDGDDHDEPCVEANGQIWTIEEARERRLEHPNCRRAFLPITAVT